MGINAEIGSVEKQDLARGERKIEVGALCHDANQPLDRDLIFPHVEFANPGLAAGGRTRVVKMPAVVDLPAPLGPSRQNISPGLTLSEMPSRATICDFGCLPLPRGEALANPPTPAARGGAEV